MAEYKDGCPRCGGTIEEPISEELFCLNKRCNAWWSDPGALKRETIARDVAGTRTEKVGDEYIAGGQVETDVTELVALVEYMTYEKVLTNLRSAIEGRKSPAYRTKHGHSIAAVEVDALQKMYNWVLKQSEAYGKDEDDNLF